MHASSARCRKRIRKPDHCTAFVRQIQRAALFCRERETAGRNRECRAPAQRQRITVRRPDFQRRTPARHIQQRSIGNAQPPFKGQRFIFPNFDVKRRRQHFLGFRMDETEVNKPIPEIVRLAKPRAAFEIKAQGRSIVRNRPDFDKFAFFVEVEIGLRTAPQAKNAIRFDSLRKDGAESEAFRIRYFWARQIDGSRRRCRCP